MYSTRSSGQATPADHHPHLQRSIGVPSPSVGDPNILLCSDQLSEQPPFSTLVSVQAIPNPRLTQSSPQITTNFLRPPPTSSLTTPPPVNSTIIGATTPMLHEQFTSISNQNLSTLPNAHLATVDLSQPSLHPNHEPNTFTPFPNLQCNPQLTIPQSFSIPSNTTTSPHVHLPTTIAPTQEQAAHIQTQAGHSSRPLPHLSYAAALNIPQQARNIPPLLPDIPLEYKAPGIHNGIPSVSFSQDEMSNVVPLFAHSVVLKFSGRNPALARIREEVAKWGIVNPYSVGIIDYGHTLLRMTSPEDLRRAQSIEMKKIDGCLFRCLKWSPGFTPKKESSLTPIWVQFPWIPFTLYAHSYMSRIAGTTGTLLRLDTPTMDCTRLRFARACIEVDLSVPLPQAIWIITPDQDGFKQAIAYESNTSYCTRCSLHGHSLNNCRFIKSAASTQPTVPQTTQQNPINSPLQDCNHNSPSPTPTPPTKSLNTHIHFSSPTTNSQIDSLLSKLPTTVENVEEATNDSDEEESEVEASSDLNASKHKEESEVEASSDCVDQLEEQDQALKASKHKKKKNKGKKKPPKATLAVVLVPSEAEEELSLSSSDKNVQLVKESLGCVSLTNTSVLNKEMEEIDEIDDVEDDSSEPALSPAFLAMQISLKELRAVEAKLLNQGVASQPQPSSDDKDASDGNVDGFIIRRNDLNPG